MVPVRVCRILGTRELGAAKIKFLTGWIVEAEVKNKIPEMGRENWKDSG